MSQHSPFTPIAIVGAGCIMPGATGIAGFWQNILGKRDLITDIPAGHWHIGDYFDADPKAPDMTYAQRGAFLPEVPFDAMGWGIPPSILPATDTSQLLALIVAKMVLDDAARGRADRDLSRTSVILGVTGAQELLASLVSRLQHPIWAKSLREMGLPEEQVQDACSRIANHYVPWQEASFPGLLGNVVAGRIANRLDLGGTNCIVDAACASALSAIHMAIAELALGHSDMVVTGGVDTLNDIFMYMCFSKTPALSPTGDCRPFSDEADGTLLGEGLGMVALKRLADAERDGDQVYAVIRGLGTSSDGRSKSVYAPVSEGQAVALKRCYESAGYGPDSVDLVEAHGTATKAGDAAEVRGLRLVFDGTAPDPQWCAVGSIKSQIGHTKAAAGVAGLLKVVLALHHKVLPPTIKVKQPAKAGDFQNSPFYVNTEPRPWVRRATHPRRGSVSSFGFGGSNFHVTCEEYVGPAAHPPRFDTWPAELAVFAAPTAEALVAAINAAKTEVATPEGTIALARRTQLAWNAGAAHRCAVLLTGDGAKALDKATAAIAKGGTTKGGVWYTPRTEPGKVAFLFPGQGSQYLRMGEALASTFAPALSAWDDADALFPLGDRLSFVAFPRPVFDAADASEQEQKLVRTEWAQPAIGVASVATMRLLATLGLHPDVTGGHSFGELTALHAAGVIDYPTLVRAARARGELMAAAAERPGAMAAVAAAPEAIRPHLIDGVVIANYNTHEQTVIAGATDGVLAVMAALDGAGLRATRLPVATAFHSTIVESAGESLTTWLRDQAFSPARIPVYSNTTAAPHDCADLPGALGAHLKSAVRFVEEIEAMHRDGVRTFIEVGPGAVLTGLVTRILDGKPIQAFATDSKQKDGLTTLLSALGHAAAAGLPVDFAPLWAERFVAPPVEPPKMAVPISGTNYGKPWPATDHTGPSSTPNAPVAKAIAASAPAPAAENHAASSVPAAPAWSTPVSEAAPWSPPPTVLETNSPIAPFSLEASMPTSDTNPWIAAFVESQRQTAEIHDRFQRTLADTHLAWLRGQESISRGILGVLAGRPIDAPVYASAAPVYAPVPSAAPSIAPSVSTAAPVPVAMPAIAVAPTAAPSVAAPPPPAPVLASAPSVPVPPTPVPASLIPTLLAVVADKTGYPVEMLRLDMNLEADLGIDSIKRVEILSALRERSPDLPEIGAETLGTLQTLQQIVDALPGSTSAAATPQAPTESLIPTLLAVVADKTGYPVEMLRLDMNLEADLGIDSIKRVEILSALRERSPELPEIGAETLGTLQTLQQIVDALPGGAPNATAPAPMATPAISPAAAASATPVPSTIHRFEVALHPLDPGTTIGLPAVTLVGGDPTFSAALAELLRARGVDAQVGTPTTSRGTVYLGGLASPATIAEAREIVRSALTAAQHTRLDTAGVWITVTALGGAFGMAGTDRTSSVLAGLPGLTKTIAREHPDARVRTIDLDSLDVDTLAGELTRGGPVEVGLLQGKRHTLAMSIVDEAATAMTGLGGEDVVVVTGGARGVTAACLVELARTTGARLAVFGRSRIDNAESPAVAAATDEPSVKKALFAENPGLPPADLGRRAAAVLAAREARTNLDAMRTMGSDVHYYPLDVQDRAALDLALADIRAKWGPVTALVHGAGVIADRRLAEKTAAQFDSVFDTKVLGALALLEATDADPVRVLVFFSSVAARAGNPGQVDYAAANEVLNKLAASERKRRPGLVAKAIGWGPWEGGMVTPALKKQFEARGVALIPLDLGASLFVAEIGHRPEVVEIVVGGGEDLDGPRPHSRTIHARDYPFLRDHTLAENPVFPVVLALEWFMQIAREIRPGRTVAACRDLQVLKGITLDAFDGDGDTFEVTATDTGPDRVNLELRRPGGMVHYRGTIEYAGAASPAPKAPKPGPLTRYPHGTEEIYNRLLFHGPEFQVIRHVNGVSDMAAAAELDGVDTAGWPEAPWATDPAAFDGGLQLALLWTRHHTQSASLPTRIDAYVPYGSPAAGPVTCVLRGRKAGSRNAVSDLSFIDRNGSVFAELRGVETHTLPGGSYPTRVAVAK